MCNIVTEFDIARNYVLAEGLKGEAAPNESGGGPDLAGPSGNMKGKLRKVAVGSPTAAVVIVVSYGEGDVDTTRREGKIAAAHPHS